MLGNPISLSRFHWILRGCSLATFADNSPYFQAINHLHNCLLSLSGLNAEVTRMQVKAGAVVIQVRDGGPIEHLATNDQVERDGKHYRQLEINGCLVVWEV